LLDSEIDELERQHERDKQLVVELAALVDNEHSDLAAIESAVQRYTNFIWDHLGREEGVILPAAQKHLKSEDWAEIDAAFVLNRDPRFGGDTDMQYRRLFSRIVNLAAEDAPRSL
jgi:hemerythrin-like domain-containing protein